MKLTRAKKLRKRIALYHNSFSFREPYQILLDGNFLHTALTARLDLRNLLPKLLGGKVKAMTTQCVLAEARALGSDFGGTALELRRLEKRRCPHTGNPVDASECISSIIGKTNEHRYCVATQDAGLRKKLREVPGVPIILISKSVVVLEHASKATEEFIKQMELKKTMPVDFEKKVLKMDGTDKVGGSTEEKKKKKPKKKEPNPLSVKKPKKVVSSQATSTAQSKREREEGMDSDAVEAAQEEQDSDSNDSDGPEDEQNDEIVDIQPDSNPELGIAESDVLDSTDFVDAQEFLDPLETSVPEDAAEPGGNSGKRKRPRKKRDRRKKKRGDGGGDVEGADGDNGSEDDSD